MFRPSENLIIAIRDIGMQISSVGRPIRRHVRLPHQAQAGGLLVGAQLSLRAGVVLLFVSWLVRLWAQRSLGARLLLLQFRGRDLVGREGQIAVAQHDAVAVAARAHLRADEAELREVELLALGRLLILRTLLVLGVLLLVADQFLAVRLLAVGAAREQPLAVVERAAPRFGQLEEQHDPADARDDREHVEDAVDGDELGERDEGERHDHVEQPVDRSGDRVAGRARPHGVDLGVDGPGHGTHARREEGQVEHEAGEHEPGARAQALVHLGAQVQREHVLEGRVVGAALAVALARVLARAGLHLQAEGVLRGLVGVEAEAAPRVLDARGAIALLEAHLSLVGIVIRDRRHVARLHVESGAQQNETHHDAHQRAEQKRPAVHAVGDQAAEDAEDDEHGGRGHRQPHGRRVRLDARHLDDLGRVVHDRVDAGQLLGGHDEAAHEQRAPSGRATQDRDPQVAVLLLPPGFLRPQLVGVDSDLVELAQHIGVLVAPDPLERLERLLGPVALQEPARRLGHEDEAHELDDRGHGRQPEHPAPAVHSIVAEGARGHGGRQLTEGDETVVQRDQRAADVGGRHFGYVNGHRSRGQADGDAHCEAADEQHGLGHGKAHDDRARSENDARHQDHRLPAVGVARASRLEREHPRACDGYADNQLMPEVVQMEHFSHKNHRAAHDARVVAEQEAAHGGKNGHEIDDVGWLLRRRQ